MSQAVNSTIDERIVEMKFDNKQFESGVKQTMSTLDKLKEALHFNTDTKGIEKIQNSFNNFNLQAPMAAVDAFSSKLSALQIFGKRIVENLADDFYGAVMKVKSAITGVFNQISTGGANRALNIEQAKFQLEGLHIAWEDIKGDIDYAVSGTAYGLDAAAKVAAQLSASQIQVGEDMKNALRGISGVAAMTNSSYEDIGRVFTQVAGAGRLYTQDMLQLSSRGLNVAAALATQLGKTEGEIREMVTKGQIDFKTFSTAMNEAFGEQATKANDTYTGSLSNVKAALSRIGADIKAGHFETFRQVFVDLIPKINEFKKAFKPVENVIIEVEAAIGRLIQNVIKVIDVKKIVEKISPPIEKIGKKILDIVDVIGKAIGKVDEITKGFKGFTYVSREMAMELEGLGDSVTYVSDKAEENIELTEDMQKAFEAAKDIWNSGKYGNGQARIDALTAAGIDPKKTQEIIEEFIKNGNDWDAAIKKVSEDTGEAVDENTKKADKLKGRVKTLATIFYNIKRTIKAVAESVTNVVSALIKSVTGSMEDLGLGDILVKVTGKIADLAEKFTITKEKAEKLTKPVQFLLSILKTIVKTGVRVIKFVATLLLNIGKLIYSLGKTIYESEAFQNFIFNVSAGFDRIGKAISDFVKNAKASEGLKKFVDILKLIGGTILNVVLLAITKIVDGIAWAIPHIESFFGKVADFFKGLFNGIIGVGGKIGDIFKGLFTGVVSIGSTIGEFFKGLFDKDGKEGEKEVGDTIAERIFGFIKGVFDWVAEKFNKHTLDEYLVVIKELISIAVLLESSMLIKKLMTLSNDAVGMLKSVKKMIDSTTKVNKSIASLNKAKAFGEIAKVFLAFAASVSLIMFTTIKVTDYISSSAEHAEAFQKAIDKVKEVMGKLLLSMLAVIGVLEFSELAISVFTSKNKLHVSILLQFAAFFFALGYAVKQIVKAMTDLYNMDDDVFKEGGKRLITIATGIGAFFVALSAITAVINRVIGGGADSATKGLYALSLILISVAASIDILMVAVAWMGILIEGFGYDTVVKSVKMVTKMIVTIMGMTAVLIAAMSALIKVKVDADMTKTFLALSSVFLAIGVSMLAIIVAINDLTLSMRLFPTETAVAFAMVVGTIVGIMAVCGFLIAQSKGLDEKGIEALGKVKIIIIALLGIILALSWLSAHIDNSIQLGAIGVAMFGILGILALLTEIMKVVGKEKPKPKAIASLALVIGSLALILTPLMAFDNFTKEDIASIFIAMAGLNGILAIMIPLMKVIGKEKPKPKAIASLAVVFLGMGALVVSLRALKNDDWQAYLVALGGLSAVLGVMVGLMAVVGKTKPEFPAILSIAAALAACVGIIAPLGILKNEDWQAYLVAMGGLVAVIGMFTLMMKVLGTGNAGTMFTASVAFTVFAAALTILGVALGLVSKSIDEGKLTTLVLDLILLTAVLTAVVVIAGKFPASIAAALGFAGSLLIIASAVAIVAGAIGYLINKFPEFENALYSFVYFVGQIPRILVGSLLGKTKEELGINLPSTKFYEIGYFCIAGLFNGLVGGLQEIVTKLSDLLHKYIIDPIKSIFDEHSPSKVFEEIGGYLGEGLELGLTEKLEQFDFSSVTDFKDNLTENLTGNLGGVGEMLGGDILSGIGDGLNVDNLNLDSFDIEGVLGGKLGNIDFSQFSGTMGAAITDSVAEGIQGVDPTKLGYSIEDLMARPDLYDILKKSIGENGVVAAYDEMMRHEDFLAKYPTFKDYFDHLEENFSEEESAFYREIMATGSDEAKEGLEQYLVKNYMDQAKLDNVVLQYSKAYQESMNKYLGNMGVSSLVKQMLDKKNSVETTAKVKLTAVDEEGNSVMVGVQNLLDSGLDLNLDNSTLNTNLNNVSDGVSDSINAAAESLGQKLTDINDKINTFDTNQSNRITNVTNRMDLLESAIRSMQLRLDTGALVGQLVVPLDRAFGERASRKSRG